MTLEIIIDNVLDPLSDCDDINMIDLWDNLTNSEQRALLKTWIDEGRIETVHIFKKEN